MQKLQKQYDNRLINRLKNSDDKTYYLTLPEFCQYIQNKDNYYQFGVKGYFMPEEEVSIFIHTAPARRQYGPIEKFLCLIENNIFTPKHKNYQKYERLIKQYDISWYEFEEKIYRTPLQLHIRDFENFFLFCIWTHQKPGYENYYHNNPYKFGVPQDRIENIKHFCSIVIDDLIEDLERFALNPSKQKKQIGKKTTIFINKEKGIYKDNSKKNYPIKGKRLQLLNCLKDGKKDGKILSQNLQYKNLSQLNKEIKEINTNFKKKLNLKKDLIIHVPTGGYKLNHDYYKIKFTNSN